MKTEVTHCSLDYPSANNAWIHEYVKDNESYSSICTLNAKMNTEINGRTISKKKITKEIENQENTILDLKSKYFWPGGLGIHRKKLLEHIGLINLLRNEVSVNTIDLRNMQRMDPEIHTTGKQIHNKIDVPLVLQSNDSSIMRVNMSNNCKNEQVKNKSQENKGVIGDVLEEFKHILEASIKEKNMNTNEKIFNALDTQNLQINNLKMILDALNSDNSQKNKKKMEKDMKKEFRDPKNPTNNDVSS